MLNSRPNLASTGDGFVNQPRNSGAQDDRNNVPLPFHHSDERDETHTEREPIKGATPRPENVNAEPDREV
jgi:hypothetical protein